MERSILCGRRALALAAAVFLAVSLSGCEDALGALLPRDPVPGVPEPKVQAGDGQITVDWPPVPGARGYQLEWSSDPWFAGPTGMVSVPRGPCTLKGLANGVPCYVRLRASLPSGTSVPSAPAAAVPRPAGPAPDDFP